MSSLDDMSTMTLTTALAAELRVSVMRLTRRLRAERSGHTLTLTQVSTLSTLDVHGPLTPGELAGHEHVQPPSMTRVLAVLVERGLVERAPHPTDGRQHLVSLTEAARALLREDRRRREAWLSRGLAELTPDERDILRRAVPVIERVTRR